MNKIEHIIDSWDWKLKVFASRYGPGFWATLLPNKPYSDAIEDQITGGDMEAMPMISYLENEGAWLPTVLAPTLQEAIEHLNEKITHLYEQAYWSNDVSDAVDELIDGEISYFDIEHNPNLKTVLLQPLYLEKLNSK